jgi:hypothetical protein
MPALTRTARSDLSGRSLAWSPIPLLHIDRFLLINKRAEEELRRYWIDQLHEQQTMGKAYVESFELWTRKPGRHDMQIANAANEVAVFLHHAALYAEAESLVRCAIDIDEHGFGKDHPAVARDLNNVATLLQETNRLIEKPETRKAATTASLGSWHLVKVYADAVIHSQSEESHEDWSRQGCNDFG